MTYPGGKNTSYQKIINLIPPHEVFVSPYLGSGAIMRNKRLALRNIGGDLDKKAFEVFHSLASPEVRARTELIILPALDLIKEFGFQCQKSTFIYLDPPYPFAVRSSKRPLYTHEMGEWEDHITLLKLILQCDCMVMISSYWSELYADMLQNWNSHSFQVQTRGGSTATEWVWMNYPRPERLHDYRYLGNDFTQRQQIKRKKNRNVQKFQNMDPLERAALFWGLEEAGLL